MQLSRCGSYVLTGFHHRSAGGRIAIAPVAINRDSDSVGSAIAESSQACERPARSEATNHLMNAEQRTRRAFYLKAQLQMTVEIPACGYQRVPCAPIFSVNRFKHSSDMLSAAV